MSQPKPPHPKISQWRACSVPKSNYEWPLTEKYGDTFFKKLDIHLGVTFIIIVNTHASIRHQY